MTDRATPLTAEDIWSVKEVLDSQVRLGHAMTLMPTDVLARLLDAATSRPGLAEEVESAIRLAEAIPHSADVEQAGMQAEVVIATLRAALTPGTEVR